MLISGSCVSLAALSGDGGVAGAGGLVVAADGAAAGGAGGLVFAAEGAATGGALAFGEDAFAGSPAAA